MTSTVLHLIMQNQSILSDLNINIHNECHYPLSQNTEYEKQRHNKGPLLDSATADFSFLDIKQGECYM